NPGQEDGCNYPSKLPARSYTDDWCSFASNEVAINWNAPLVFLAAGLDTYFESNAFADLNREPQPPLDLRATTEASQVFLKWITMDADVSKTIIERSAENTKDFEAIGEVSGNVLGFIDENAANGRHYYY